MLRISHTSGWFIADTAATYAPILIVSRTP